MSYRRGGANSAASACARAAEMGTPEDEALQAAAQKYDLAAIEAALDSGANIECTDWVRPCRRPASSRLVSGGALET